jgi:hypothetical protein
MFDNGQRNPINVGFLESITADGMKWDLTRNYYHWNRVHVSRGNSRNEVSCPRSRSPKAYSDSTRRASIAIGGVGGSLLVADEDVLDFAAFFSAVESIVDRQNCAAWIAKNMPDAVAN